MTGLPRRDVLRGLGVAITLPNFASLRAESEIIVNEATKRFVCVSPTYGMNPGGFFPTETGSDYKMPPLLESLEPHRDCLSLFTNLDHPGVGGGHGCSNTFLNGVELKSTKENPQRLLSLDQLLAEHVGQHTRFPSMLLGAGGFSWSRAGIRLPTQSDPVRVFTNLFVDDAAKSKQDQVWNAPTQTQKKNKFTMPTKQGNRPQGLTGLNVLGQ